MEGTRKTGRQVKDGETGVEKHINVVGLRKKAGNGQRPSGMEEDSSESHGPP